jgi:hypothetical protein
MFFKLSVLMLLAVPVLTENLDDISLINAYTLSDNNTGLGPDCGCTVLAGIFSESSSKILFFQANQIIPLKPQTTTT